ncbi:MAG: hypothetical protein K9J12_12250 [Melioribacteraceae bacterium]|nr:hypothetical protein [Melioribacteraceae bacterium]MCF8263746.1 hypothetical protein [Melioribacteraceae bacterium]MCF8412673.1 hypothetical protein [Melioribacteraceae bacterium]MCF8430981.1 hypothetical protein [Melioribacteraceae bacterium]
MLVILQAQIKEEANYYIEILTNLSNPIYFSIIVSIILILVTIVVLRYIVIPLIKKHQLEKTEMELKTARLTALFAELDPDPVLRIDKNGRIIDSNAQSRILLGEDIHSKFIDDILPTLIKNPSISIQENDVISLVEKIGGKYYDIFFKGFADLEIGQIYFHDITDNINYQNELIESRSKYRNLSDRLQEILEIERSRIAGELHDSVGQKLSSLKIGYQKQLENEISNKRNEINLINDFDSIITELREISYTLKPKLLEELGLEQALNAFFVKFYKHTNIKTEFLFTGPQVRYIPELELTLYRITQEAYQNILKHSKATECFVQLKVQNGFLRMIISDNGTGFSAEDEDITKGLGLFNMEERVAKFNGKMKIDSSIGEGTNLIFEIENAKTR